MLVLCLGLTDAASAGRRVTLDLPGRGRGWRGITAALITASCLTSMVIVPPSLAQASAAVGKVEVDGEANRIFRKARQVESDGDPSAAMKLYEEIVQVTPLQPLAAILIEGQAEPEFIYGWSNLGNVLAAVGNLDESLLCYKKAISLRPPPESLAVILLNKASVENGLNQIDAALRDLNAAESIAGPTSNILSNKAVALTKLGRWEEACSIFEKIISSADRYALPWWLRYSMALLETNRGMESVAYVQRVLNRFPDEDECKAFAAALYTSLGSVAEGRKYFESIPEDQRKQYTSEFLKTKLFWGGRAVAGFSKLSY